MIKPRPKSDIIRLLFMIMRSPGFVMLAVSLLILALNIAFIGRLRPFNSDDLYWNQVLREWQPFSGETMYLGTKDIFVHQLPFIWAMEQLFTPGRRLLIIETYILTAAAFVLTYISALYFLKKLKVRPSYLNMLPFVWLASFGFAMVENYLNVNWRSFEIGICVATYALVAAYLYGDIKPFRSVLSKVISFITIVFIGVVIYSDPYYIFFTIAPLLLFALVLFALKKITKKQTITVAAAIALSMIFAKIASAISAAAGLIIVHDTPSAFVNFDDIVTNIVHSLHGLFIIFNADFFGRPAFNPATTGSMVNFAILSYIIYRAFTLVSRSRRSDVSKMQLSDWWPVFFAATLGIIFLVYTSSTLVVVSNYRFYILFAYTSVVLLVLILAISRNSRAKLIIGALLLVGTVYNTASTLFTSDVSGRSNVAGNVKNSLNFQIIEAAKSEGLTKGYGSYWQGNVNTYLSGGKLHFLPSLCDNKGKTHAFKWLINQGQFDVKADRSFYILDPDIPAPAICSEEQLINQFGKPEKIILLENKKILVFNYDITSKIK